MAGLKGSMVGFVLILVCLAVVPSVNGNPCALFPAEDVIAGQPNRILSPILVFACVVGACTFQSQCYPGLCVLGQCDCPEGYSNTRSSCSANQCDPKCRNGGTCTSSGYCDCAPGYSGPYCQSSNSSSDTIIGIVIGCLIGIFVIICCIFCTVIYLTKSKNANQRRSSPAVAPYQVPHTSAAVMYERRSSPAVAPYQVPRTSAVVIYERVTPVPSYPTLEPSEPPPYTADLMKSPLATYLEYTPTSQPFPPEFIPIEDDLPPEYLPPLPESELEMLPLHGAPPTNPDAPSDPPASTDDLSMSEHHPPAGSDNEAPPVQGAPHMDVNAPPSCVPSTHLQSSSSAPCTSNSNSCSLPTSVEDTPTPQPLLPESPLPISNDEDVGPEYLPPPGSSA